jgi:hypothetical protein
MKALILPVTPFQQICSVIGPHSDDEFLIDSLPAQAEKYGFPPTTPFEPCPGHTPGHVVFFHRAARVAWVGDVIFAGSIGRSDLPRGNHAQLVQSIREKLFPLGDDVTFVPGHGPTSTFGHERQTNPFVADNKFR